RVCFVCGCHRGRRGRFKQALEVVQETSQATRVLSHRCLLCLLPVTRAFRGDARVLRHGPSLCETSSTRQGFLCQTSAAWSAIVRSLENVPAWPALRIAFRPRKDKTNGTFQQLSTPTRRR